jgi:hypothetical protein
MVIHHKSIICERIFKTVELGNIKFEYKTLFVNSLKSARVEGGKKFSSFIEKQNYQKYFHI